MDTEKCRVLLTAANEGTISRAAERLNYSVSGVSRSISALETECGFPLLHRERTGVTLTEAGKQLLPTLRALVHLSQQLDDEVNAIKGLSCGSVTVGVAYADHFRRVTRVIRTFQQQYPDISVNVIQGTSTELRDALLEHRADFILASRREGPFRYLPLEQVPMCACVPPDHPAVTDAVYPLSRFETDHMIAPYSEAETDYARSLWEQHIVPNIIHVTTDVYSAYSMVEAGLGVAFLNRLEPACWSGDVVLLPTQPPVLIDVGIMLPEEPLSPSAEKFFRLLLEK